MTLYSRFAAHVDAALDAPVHMPRGMGRVQIDVAAHMLQHLFSHQTHHRGQVHAMLSSTGVAPPQLDEFLMGLDGPVDAIMGNTKLIARLRAIARRAGMYMTSKTDWGGQVESYGIIPLIDLGAKPGSKIAGRPFSP